MEHAVELLAPDLALWRCACGIEFEKSIEEVSEVGPKCRYCLSYGQSRFEHEVLYCLQLMLPRIEIKPNFTKPGYKKYVDLYFPQFDLAIELDPYITHRHVPERDFRVLERLKPYYRHIVRVRDIRLPYMAGSIIVPEMEGNAAKEWAQLVVTVPQLRNYVVQVPEAHLNHALERAVEDWRGQVTRPERPLSLELHAEEAFVQNLTRTGRRPAFIQRASSDSCVWRCLHEDCGQEYQQRAFRWVQGIRCPQHRGERIRISPHKRWKHEHLTKIAPDLFAELQGIVGQPYTQLEEVTFASRVTCVWRCPECATTYEMSPNSRRKGTGCPNCSPVS
jgi:hypothetical protein